MEYLINSEHLDNTVHEIKEKYPSKFERGRFISFAHLKEDNMFDSAKILVKWAVTRIHYIFEELNKINLNTFGKKKRFEAMLDDL